MSLYGALMTGVSGLNANSMALSVASSNIANVNTIGYKNAVSNFNTLLAAAAGSGDVSSAGVTASAKQTVSTQGLLSTTASGTDLAISGNGFFVVSQGPVSASADITRLYTRAGNFTPDATGNLKNSSGFYLLGWPLDTAGNIPTDRNAMQNINMNSLSGSAEATTTMTLQANLQASTTAVGAYTPGDMDAGTVTPHFQRTINVYDSQGGAQPLQVAFVKTGANTWAYEVSYQGNVANIGGAGNNPLATGEMSFNPDGTLADADTSTALVMDGEISLTIPWDPVSGLAPQAITIDMGTPDSSNGLTQFDNASSLGSSNVDGALFGSLSGISVDSDGYVTASFTNGLAQRVYKLPIATFANPNGLAAMSGNVYATSNDSGTVVLGEANLGGAGAIQSQALEGSTVDLATEFTNLITTQRAYSASSRIVTTASEMLDQLLQMR